MGLLVLAAIVGGLLVGKKKNIAVSQGARAVLVATTDRARTVVVPPCATGVPVTPATAAAQSQTPGSTSVLLPPGGGVRTLLVPRCTSATAANLPGAANLPSAVFVLAAGVQLPTQHESQTMDEASRLAAFTKGVNEQLVVQPGSAVATVVVPRCAGNGPKVTNGSNGPTTVLNPQAGTPAVALAPPC
jgi:hypothetical protein